jgi:hypothetical protein
MKRILNIRPSNYDIEMKTKYIIIIVGLGFLILVAALPFFSLVASRMPTLLAFCGITIN